MKYFFKKLQKAATFAASLLKSERKYHTLILLGDDGKVKHIRILRGMIVTLLLVQVIILSSGAYFFFSGMRFIKDKSDMENALIISQKNYMTIRDEKDMLMARLVLAESQTNKETGVAAASKQAGISANDTSIQIPRTHVSNGRILIDKINVSHEAAGNRLKIEFDIKSSSRTRQVSGYSFVVLKDDEIDEAGWLSVPSVPLALKKPAAINKGLYFSTPKLTAVKLTTNIKSAPAQFTLATVFVYSASGELILEKDFPVLLRFSKEI